MPERAYLSIGEVLALLKDEFADITISKIRFLESQGLIDPERTPSGYRKFYEPDVERLRWILRQQKEHYLPLRVIKGKLSEATAGEDGGRHHSGSAGAPPALTAVPDPPDERAETNGARLSARDVGRRDHLQPGAGEPAERLSRVPDGRERESRRPGGPADRDPRRPGLPAERLARTPSGQGERERSAVGGPGQRESARPVPSTDRRSGPADRASGRPGTPSARESPGAEAEEARRPAPPFPESLRRSGRSSPTGYLTAPEPRPPAGPPTTPVPSPPPARVDQADVSDEEVELTADELAAASGLPASAVAELERYGLVKGKRGPGGRYYDADALEVARLAVAFAQFGVEARHLKMWKTAADREADFYEQVVTPLRSQRSTKARRQAGDTVTELAGLGTRLHAALVAGAMKRQP